MHNGMHNANGPLGTALDPWMEMDARYLGEMQHAGELEAKVTLTVTLKLTLALALALTEMQGSKVTFPE